MVVEQSALSITIAVLMVGLLAGGFVAYQVLGWLW
jgi:cytochrome c biogenesis factor